MCVFFCTGATVGVVNSIHMTIMHKYKSPGWTTLLPSFTSFANLANTQAMSNLNVAQFDTQSVCPVTKPQLDTFAQVDFPRLYVAPPSLPVGIRELDIGNSANIRARAKVENITKNSAVYHITSWGELLITAAFPTHLIFPLPIWRS